MKIISICKLILIAASTVTSINSVSKELDPTVCGTRVGWFINGVQNSSDEARLNAKKLEDILAASKSTQDIQVKLA